MRVALLVVSLIAFALTEVPNPAGIAKLLQQQCGYFTSYSSFSLAFSGREVLIGARPWMAILKYGNESKSKDFHCIGTLITERYVLTSANCVINAIPITVRLGELKISTKEDCTFIRGRRRCIAYEEYGVEKAIYEDYHDLALLRLASDVSFKPHIAPICLPVNATLRLHEETFENYTMTGWGFVENPENSDVLRESYVVGVKSDPNEDNELLGRTEVAGCHGDLGAPLTEVDIYLEEQRVVQFGVLRSGLRDCPEKQEISFTGVSKLIPWITKKIGDAKEEQKIIGDISCTRRDNSFGYCRKASQCPEIRNFIKEKNKISNFTSEQLAYVKNSGSTMCPKGTICCDDKQNVTSGMNELKHLDCGARNDNQIYRPWLAVLETQLDTDNSTSFSCTGTLVHKRYVLTAAECLDNRKVISVRLGEYDLSKTIDCRPVINGLCKNDVINIAPERIFKHENYSKASYQYDIALIKLAKDVEFHDNISPICLPITDIEESTIDKLFTSGWVWTNTKGKISPVASQEAVKYTKHEDCAKTFTKLAPSQLCTSKGDLEEKGYSGHPGRPLFNSFYVWLEYLSPREQQQRFTQIGISSTVWRDGHEAIPTYTKVSSFIRWIAFKIGTY